MRILQLCTKPPYPPHDGGSLASFSLMQSMLRQGHKITLLTMCTQKHGMSDRDKEKLSALTRLHTTFLNTSVTPHGFLFNLLFSKLPYNAVRFISKKFDRTLTRILQLSVFDVIQLEGLYLMPYADTIRRNSKALIVLRAHNVEHEIWMRIAAQENRPLRKWYFSLLASRIRAFESSMTDKYDLLVPITERDQKRFSDMGNRKPAKVIPAGIDASGEIPALPKNPGLFFLGSLDWMPNQEGLLWFIEQVWPRLASTYPGLTFQVAGRNAPEWFIRKIQRPGIVYLGEVPAAAPFIVSNGILVAPCFSGGGMRVKILEAMQHARPVITTAIGAEGLGATHGEHILLCETPMEFEAAVDELITDPDRYRDIALKGVDFVHNHFDNQTLASELTVFYQSNLP